MFRSQKKKSQSKADLGLRGGRRCGGYFLFKLYGKYRKQHKIKVFNGESRRIDFGVFEDATAKDFVEF